MKFIILLIGGLSIGMMAGCSDEKNVNIANQEALNSPEIVGTNNAGKILYRVYLHNVASASGDYFYYWDVK